jgi:predicted enzyme related to lactoylglutathione lyase
LRGLTTVTYVADDPAAAADWYGKLLGTEPYFKRREYVEFRLGDYQHELGILDRRYRPFAGSPGSPPAPAGAVVYWHVDDVAATLERLIAMGARELEAPRDFGQGFVGASVVDPFGNILGLMHNPHYLDVLGRIPAFELPEIKPVAIPALDPDP